jgi:hypothetical protein
VEAGEERAVREYAEGAHLVVEVVRLNVHRVGERATVV